MFVHCLNVLAVWIVPCTPSRGTAELFSGSEPQRSALDSANSREVAFWEVDHHDVQNSEISSPVRKLR